MDNKPLRVACYARYSTSMQRGVDISTAQGNEEVLRRQRLEDRREIC